MANIEINIALNRIIGAFTYTVKGKSEAKECVCIPKDILSVDKNGNCWFNAVGYEEHKFDKQTHSIKQYLTKAQYDALPSDENGKKALLPFLGAIKVKESRYSNNNVANAISGSNNADDNDLPF